MFSTPLKHIIKLILERELCGISTNSLKQFSFDVNTLKLLLKQLIYWC
jgi:hypothetical protein